MSTNTYVFGHQNPDTDSICSALAYTHLKKALGYKNTIACRLGDINKETRYVLNYFNVEPPQYLETVRPQVSDLHFPKVSTVTEEISVKTTLDKIVSYPGRSLPVVDSEKKLVGVVSLPDIIGAVTGAYEQSILSDNKTPYKNIIYALDARTIGDIPSEYVTGNIYTNSELTPGEPLNADDFIVTSLRDGSLAMAFTNGAKNIIISSTPIGTTPDIPADYDGLVILSDFAPFEVIRIMSQVIPIANFVRRDKLEYFIDYETIDDVKANMLSSSHSRFPVVNEHGVVLATISRSNLLDYNRKKVILVDHNERSQSIKGVDEAEIVEVIDHHRIAEISTAAPLYMRIEPVGCTSTIIARIYKEKSIPIPRPLAGIMLSAIISDTLLFNSPTCTDMDRRIADELASIAGVDLIKYGKEMLISGSNIAEMTPREIIDTDRKHFTMGNYRVMISQINTGDFKGIFRQLDSVLKVMNDECDAQGFDLALLMVTDIVLGGTELLVAGKIRELAEIAFGIASKDISRYLPGVFSRKKQIVPPLMNAAASIG